MVQVSSSEANISQTTEIPHILWKPIIQYSGQRSPSLVLILLAPNDIYISRTTQLTSRRCILNIYSKNKLIEHFKHAAHSPFFLTYVHRRSQWYLSFSFPHQDPSSIFPVSHTFHMPLLSLPPWFDHRNIISPLYTCHTHITWRRILMIR